MSIRSDLHTLILLSLLVLSTAQISNSSEGDVTTTEADYIITTLESSDSNSSRHTNTSQSIVDVNVETSIPSLWEIETSTRDFDTNETIVEETTELSEPTTELSTTHATNLDEAIQNSSLTNLTIETVDSPSTFVDISTSTTVDELSSSTEGLNATGIIDSDGPVATTQDESTHLDTVTSLDVADGVHLSVVSDRTQITSTAPGTVKEIETFDQVHLSIINTTIRPVYTVSEPVDSANTITRSSSTRQPEIDLESTVSNLMTEQGIPEDDRVESELEPNELEPTTALVEEETQISTQTQIYIVAGTLGGLLLLLIILVLALALSVARLKDQISNRHQRYIPTEDSNVNINRPPRPIGDQIHAYDNSAFNGSHEMSERMSDSKAEVERLGYEMYNGRSDNSRYPGGQIPRVFPNTDRASRESHQLRLEDSVMPVGTGIGSNDRRDYRRSNPAPSGDMSRY